MSRIAPLIGIHAERTSAFQNRHHKYVVCSTEEVWGERRFISGLHRQVNKFSSSSCKGRHLLQRIRSSLCLLSAVFVILNLTLLILTRNNFALYQSRSIRQHVDLWLNLANANYSWPPHHADVSGWVRKLLDGNSTATTGDDPQAPTADALHHLFEHPLRTHAPTVCHNSSDVRLLLVVKSAVVNAGNRRAIRGTWGNLLQYNGTVQRAFVVARSREADVNRQVMLEYERHGDLVVVDIDDDYFNNTLKTMAAFRWALRFCPTADFVWFVDDDFLILVDKQLHWLDATAVQRNHSLLKGFLYTAARPYRNESSKWYVTHDEYPFAFYPPYCAGGSLLISHRTLELLTSASHYVMPFRIDDIYIGILGEKLHIEPNHTESVILDREAASKPIPENAVAVHGFGNPDTLVSRWHKMFS